MNAAHTDDEIITDIAGSLARFCTKAGKINASRMHTAWMDANYAVCGRWRIYFNETGDVSVPTNARAPKPRKGDTAASYAARIVRDRKR